MLFGLPDLTVVTVGGTIVVIIILLVIWGLRFPEED
jgi:hypothetical protein